MVPISACWARLWWHTQYRYRVKNTPCYLTVKSNVGVLSYRCVYTLWGSHQWGHVSSVHLPHSDLLLRGRHGAHVKIVGPANRAWTHDAGQSHRSVFHSAHAVKLLLQDSRPAHIQAPNMCIWMYRTYNPNLIYHHNNRSATRNRNLTCISAVSPAVNRHSRLYCLITTHCERPQFLDSSLDRHGCTGVEHGRLWGSDATCRLP